MGPAPLLLGLALLASDAGGLAMHLEDARGASPEETTALMGALREALADRSGQVLVVDPPSAGDERCREVDRCSAAVRRRTGASAVVLVRLIGVTSRIRLVADLVGPTIQGTPRVQVDFDRDRSNWYARSAEVATQLLSSLPDPAPAEPPPVASSEPAPQKKAPTPLAAVLPPGEAPAAPPGPPLLPPAEAPPGSELHVAPWIVIGASAVALGVGVALGAKAASARGEAEDPGRRPSNAEMDALNDTIYDFGLVANVLFVGAGVGAATGLALLVFD